MPAATAPHAYVPTRRGTRTVLASDWAITEPNGELHVCQHRLVRAELRARR